MAEIGAVAARGAEGPNAPRHGGPQIDWQGLIQQVLKTMTMVWVMNSVMRQFTGPPSPPSSPSAVDVTGAGDARSGTNEILPWRGPLRMMWSEGTPMVRK
jgi:hypothetical protein